MYNYRFLFINIVIKIDTLILSACGTKFIAYIGVFKYLLENKMIEINNIKEIISCSAGSIVSFIFQINKSLNILEKFIYKYNLKNIINFDDLNHLFLDKGIFSSDKIIRILQIFLKVRFYLIYLNFIPEMTSNFIIFRNFKK